MIERTPILNIISYLILLAGAVMVLAPFAMVLLAASHNLTDVNTVPMPMMPGRDLWANLSEAWNRVAFGGKLINSLIFASGVAIGKVVISAMTAFAIVYFRFRGRMVIFWAVFITLMLPLEVRIVPTYAVAANALGPFQAVLDITGISWMVQQATGLELNLQWSLLNSYTGLILPLVATATGTFLYRQFFLTIPEEFAEAARMDGAGPLRFLIDVLLPLSKANMMALFTIMFVWSWNQYLWPLLVTTDPAHATAVTELKELIPNFGGIPEWNIAMAGTLIAMAPPLLVVILMQRWFVRGLIATEK